MHPAPPAMLTGPSADRGVASAGALAGAGGAFTPAAGAFTPASGASTLAGGAFPLAGAGDALTALRAATACLHRSLDARLPLGQPGAGAAAYVHHLQTTRSWLRTLAPWLARVQGAAAGAQQLAAIERDLRHWDKAAADARAAPVVCLPSAEASDAFCWGARYVVEGSALGGQVLHRRLLQAGLPPEGLMYLRGAGTGTADGWKAFVRTLRQAQGSAAAQQQACAGAVWAFECFCVLIDLPERSR